MNSNARSADEQKNQQGGNTMAKDTTNMEIKISAPNIREAKFLIRGTAPLVVHKFSAKAKAMIRQKQEAGSLANKGKSKSAKDFEEVFQGARHISTEGWDGIPAAAFRAGIISACRLVGFKMTLAKLSIFVAADGFDETEGTPLVRILSPAEPERNESMVRLATGVCDISVRPMWRIWGAELRIQYDADQFTADDVRNLLARVGAQVGVCEGRPDSKSSAGCGWGTFELVTELGEEFAVKS